MRGFELSVITGLVFVDESVTVLDQVCWRRFLDWELVYRFCSDSVVTLRRKLNVVIVVKLLLFVVLSLESHFARKSQSSLHTH